MFSKIVLFVATAFAAFAAQPHDYRVGDLQIVHP